MKKLVTQKIELLPARIVIKALWSDEPTPQLLDAKIEYTGEKRIETIRILPKNLNDFIEALTQLKNDYIIQRNMKMRKEHAGM